MHHYLFYILKVYCTNPFNYVTRSNVMRNVPQL